MQLFRQCSAESFWYFFHGKPKMYSRYKVTMTAMATCSPGNSTDVWISVELPILYEVVLYKDVIDKNILILKTHDVQIID